MGGAVGSYHAGSRRLELAPTFGPWCRGRVARLRLVVRVTRSCKSRGDRSGCLAIRGGRRPVFRRSRGFAHRVEFAVGFCSWPLVSPREPRGGRIRVVVRRFVPDARVRSTGPARTALGYRGSNGPRVVRHTRTASRALDQG